MPIKGSPMAIRYKGLQETIDFNQFCEITSENNKTIKPLPIPNIKENIMQLLTALNPLKKFSFENSSETIQVQARLKPEVAKVTAKRYTDITKLNTPTASEPILVDIYRLKAVPILFIINAQKVNIAPLIKNIFVLLKIPPLNKYVL